MQNALRSYYGNAHLQLLNVVAPRQITPDESSLAVNFLCFPFDTMGTMDTMDKSDARMHPILSSGATLSNGDTTATAFFFKLTDTFLIIGSNQPGHPWLSNKLVPDKPSAAVGMER